MTESTADESFSASSDAGATRLFWELADNTAKEILYRAPSKSGPWEQYQTWTIAPGTDPSRRFEKMDEETSKRSTYCRLEAFDSQSRLIKSYGPVMLPRYVNPEIEDDGFMILEGPPLRLRYLDIPPKRAK